MRRRHIEDSNLSQGYLLTDKVNVNLYVFSATMMHRIGSHVDSTDIVAINNSGLGKWNVKLLEELTKPAALSNYMSNSTILCLSTGARDRRLSLGRPGDQSVAKVNTIPGGRAPRIRTTCPIDIRIGNQCIHSTGANVKTICQCTLHIAQDAFEKRQMRLPRVIA
jgi:hypothetical protein